MFPLDIATRPFVDRRLFSKYTHGRVKSNRLIWIKKRIACPPWSRLPKYNTLLILDLISWNYRFLFLFLLFQIIGNLINFLPYYFTGIISLTILSTEIILSILNSTASVIVFSNRIFNKYLYTIKTRDTSWKYFESNFLRRFHLSISCSIFTIQFQYRFQWRFKQ